MLVLAVRYALTTSFNTDFLRSGADATGTPARVIPADGSITLGGATGIVEAGRSLGTAGIGTLGELTRAQSLVGTRRQLRARAAGVSATVRPTLLVVAVGSAALAALRTRFVFAASAVERTRQAVLGRVRLADRVSALRAVDARADFATPRWTAFTAGAATAIVSTLLAIARVIDADSISTGMPARALAACAFTPVVSTLFARTLRFAAASV